MYILFCIWYTLLYYFEPGFLFKHHQSLYITQLVAKSLRKMPLPIDGNKSFPIRPNLNFKAEFCETDKFEIKILLLRNYKMNKTKKN